MSAIPPRADLRTLAAEEDAPMTDQAAPSPQSLCDHPVYVHHMRGGEPLTIPLCQLCGAVGWDDLREQVAEHRRLVLGEAAEAIEADAADLGSAGHTAREEAYLAAVALIQELAAAAPESTLSARVPAETAPAVPEDTPGGFHEPDEPTDHIQAAFDAGTHGRTAPPRGQTRRLDVAAALTAAERDVVEKAQEWRRWFRLVEVLAGAVVSGPTRALIAAVDALSDAGTDQTEDNHG